MDVKKIIFTDSVFLCWDSKNHIFVRKFQERTYFIPSVAKAE